MPIDIGQPGETDHGELEGRGEDDHTQYLLISTDLSQRFEIRFDDTFPTTSPQGGMWLEMPA